MARSPPDDSLRMSRFPDSDTKFATRAWNPRTEIVATLADTAKGAETDPTVRIVSTEDPVLL